MEMKRAILSIYAVLLIGFAPLGEAKRFGGGKTSGSYTAPAKKAENKEEAPSSDEKDKPAINIRLPVSGSGGASTAGTTMSAGTAALGAAAGSAAATALSAEEIRKINEERAREEQLARKAEEERKAWEAAEEARKKGEQQRIAALAEAARMDREKRQQEAAERRARIEKEKELELQRQDSSNQCIIKPVMTDAEMAICREVWR